MSLEILGYRPHTYSDRETGIDELPRDPDRITGDRVERIDE